MTTQPCTLTKQGELTSVIKKNWICVKKALLLSTAFAAFTLLLHTEVAATEGGAEEAPAAPGQPAAPAAPGQPAAPATSSTPPPTTSTDTEPTTESGTPDTSSTPTSSTPQTTEENPDACLNNLDKCNGIDAKISGIYNKIIGENNSYLTPDWKYNNNGRNGIILNNILTKGSIKYFFDDSSLYGFTSREIPIKTNIITLLKGNQICYPINVTEYQPYYLLRWDKESLFSGRKIPILSPLTKQIWNIYRVLRKMKLMGLNHY